MTFIYIKTLINVMTSRHNYKQCFNKIGNRYVSICNFISINLCKYLHFQMITFSLPTNNFYQVHVYTDYQLCNKQKSTFRFY